LNRAKYKSVTRSRPCPVCGGDHKCGIGDDGSVQCGRVPDGLSAGDRHNGHVFLGRSPKDPQFGLFRAEDDPVLKQRDEERRAEWQHERRRPPGNGAGHHGSNGHQEWSAAPFRPEVEAQARDFAAALTPDRRAELAQLLGLRADVFDRLPLVGWGAKGFHTGYLDQPCFTFAEQDGEGHVVGVVCRYGDGAKKAMLGHHRGLTVPKGWDQGDGPVLVVEGPSDTLAGIALGLNTVGRPSNLGRVDDLARLLKDIPPERPIVVVGENDPSELGKWPGLDGAKKTAAQLSEQLGRLVSWALPPKGTKDLRAWALGQNLPGDCLDEWHVAGERFCHDLLGRAQETKPEPATPPGDDPHHTDVGNAMRLIRRHGRDLRFCEPWEKWLHYDGGVWTDEAGQRVQRLAKETVLALFGDATQRVLEVGRQLKQLPDGDQSKRLRLKAELRRAEKDVAFAFKSEAAPRIHARIDLASSEPGVAVSPDELDRHPMLLNCRNGVVDLATGALRPHDRQDLLTAQAPVQYDPNARCPVWEGMLQTIFAGKEEMIRHVQKLLGYALTGDVREQLLIVLWGGGANGKTTLVNAVMEALGEGYAIKAGRDLLMARKMDKHPTQLARLFGKRLVVATETQEAGRLDEATVKELTGSDPVAARRMFENLWQFNPTHKLFLVTNHRPDITGTDEGIWRRVHLVPFRVRIPDDQQDKGLADKLRAELPGILAWCVGGCLLWQQEGLKAPEEVQAATKAYRSEQDVLAAFIAECCDVQQELKCRATTLYAAYKAWADRGGEGPINQRHFGRALKERGYESYTNNGTMYRGICVRQDDDTLLN
jgi:putative DNA primase/helicase